MAVINHVQNWLADATIQDRIKRAALQKGGFEGWLQVEFALYLAGQYETVQREQPYKSTVSSGTVMMDIECVNERGTGQGSYDIVELKVETIFQSGNKSDDFYTRFNADVKKIQGIVAAANKQKDFTATSIGMSVFDQTTTKVKSSVAASPLKDRIRMMEIFKGDIYNVCVFYLSFGVVNLT